MSRYKKSYYNYIYKTSDNSGYIITNIISGKIIKMNEIQKLFYDCNDIFDDDIDFIKSMIDSGILIDEEKDELKYIKNKIKEDIYDTTELYVTICVTMKCNLSCVYCFEGKDKENIDMDVDTQDRTIEFIENKIKESGAKRLHIWWYGGEPLLCPDIISNMSKIIINIVKKHNIEYKTRIVTNGTLLNQNLCDMLEKAQVQEAQITLDGATSDIHDKTRPYISGKGSFDDIVKNLYNIKTNIYIIINYIINKNNIDEYNKLKKLVDDIRKKTNNNIDLTISRMDKNEKNELDIENIMVDEIIDIDNKNKKERKVFMVCSAQKYYTFLIDARGDIYKCPQCIRNKNYIIANVKDEDIKEKCDTKEASLKFINSKWLNPNEECSKCIYLPFCVGGCVLGYRKQLCKDYYKKCIDKKMVAYIATT